MSENEKPGKKPPTSIHLFFEDEIGVTVKNCERLTEAQVEIAFQQVRVEIRKARLRAINANRPSDSGPVESEREEVIRTTIKQQPQQGA